jgi:hypothetical protein
VITATPLAHKRPCPKCERDQADSADEPDRYPLLHRRLAVSTIQLHHRLRRQDPCGVNVFLQFHPDSTGTLFHLLREGHRCPRLRFPRAPIKFPMAVRT